MAAQINLTIPLATLLGLAERPGEAAGFGPIDADLARAMAANAAAHPATTWCLTLTDQQGHPTAHGCARPTRPASTRRRAGPGGGPAGPPPRPGPPSPQTGPPRTPGTGPPGPPGTKPAAAPRRPGTGPPGPAAGTVRGEQRDGANAGNPGQRERRERRVWRDGGYSGYGTWRLRPGPGGPDLSIDLEPSRSPAATTGTTPARHDPGDRLRHLIHIRDGECTWPPCRRAARRCDFEHAIPWETGGPTCACNAGARCRHHHHQKQAQGWSLTQPLPGYHTWTTPAGRRYTTGPTTYPT